MKFKIFLLVFSLSFLFTTVITFSAAPNIVWEKYYPSVALKGLSLYYDFYKFGDKLFLIYSGDNKSFSPSPYNMGMLITDLTGNLNKQYEILRNESYNIINFEFDNNKHKHYCYKDIGGQAFSLFAINTDSNGNIIEEYRDTNKAYIAAAYFNDDDSIYITTAHPVFPFPFIDIYDKDVNFVRTVDLNIQTIPYSIPKYPPLSGFITNDKHFLISFMAYDSNGTVITILGKFNKEGQLIWFSKIDSPNSKDIKIGSIILSPDNNYIGYGRLYDTVGNRYLHFIKFNDSGQILWEKSHLMNNVNNYTDKAKLLYNGEYIAIYGKIKTVDDSKKEKFWIRLFDSNGEALDDLIWDVNGDNRIYGATESSGGNIIVYGRNGKDSLYLAEIKPNYTSVDEDNIILSNNFIEISPQPVNDYIQIKCYNHCSDNVECVLYSITGASLERFNISDSKIYNLNVSSLTPGIYYICCRTKNAAQNNYEFICQKFIKM